MYITKDALIKKYSKNCNCNKFKIIVSNNLENKAA